MEQCKLRKKLLCCLGVGLIIGVTLFLKIEKWHVLPLLGSGAGSSSPEVKKMYILTQTYGGQMTRAIRNMMTQQCWAGLHEGVGMSITEPFSSNSQLVHTAQIWNDFEKGELHTAAKFGNYYDLVYYNKQSKMHRFSSLISWKDFLYNAPRVAVAVSIPTHSCSGGKSNEACTYSKPFRSFLDGLINMGFNVTKRVCLTCSVKPYDLSDFINLLFGNYSEISVLLNTWRNYAFTRTWIKIPYYCKRAENPKSSNFLVPSSSIISHSKNYLNNFVKHKHFVGIMLRIERFLTLAVSGRSNESIESCLNKTVLIHDGIAQSLENVGTYITVDIGKYGSGIMQKEGIVSRFGKGSIGSITRSVESVFSHFYNATVTLEDWENTFVNATNGITERGYIAMLQQNIASQSDCLVLMGGGSYFF